ncbi:chemotaxis protein CheA [Thalassotalea piscium]|uniref:Chemotaxis protein CheA n=1 Tax=Thalassotalea piscium TaxID=1230533 RepID=A0A7X0NJZ3_9GAMM|nr:chemotaxis protein CheA [Thalassotalea piscium]MBB6544857.1 two-component system chemotaxis sensor kinase CheA [Thalassotalea piscium]
MSYEADEEILQDFLIEAGEILESLSEQLVELENDPNNAELLNAIFRGFHTVKGGAGFLALTELVDACHGAENVFDILRTGKRAVTADLMDVILKALDTINEMFSQVQNREPVDAADPALLEQLHRLSEPEGAAPPVETTVVVENTVSGNESSVTSSDEMSEDEFERLLDELHGTSAPSTPAVTSSNNSNDISDDEFESLLDELHGQGAFSSDVAKTPPATPANKASSNDISDDEFESLLDELHGQGKSPQTSQKPVTPAPTAAQKPAAAPASKPAPAPAAKPVAAEKKPGQSSAPQGETTVRVDTQRLDQIMNMVGELVLVRNRLTSLGMTKEDEELTKAVSNLDAVTTDLQGAVMKTRMQPIKKVFGRFPRVVRDLARTLNKDIKLILQGEETDLDKNLVEALADPLVHLVRNSVDHGIELPDDREAKGKSREGTVILSASQEGDHILLTIRDDGAGMDANKLKSIAIERGVLDEDAANRMSDKDAFALIFAPGFSTKTEISEVSGRGVGMDVVKTKITQLNGTVNIDSEMGVGTVLEIKVPLTLAILPTLMVIVGKQTFALPLAAVNEIFHLDLTNTNLVDGQLTIIVREKAIPLFYLDQWLVRNHVENKRKTGHVVIVQLGTQQIGFVVDSLIGQEEVVIKPLDRLLHGTPGMAGATITSDGGIALIIDVANMLKYYAKKSIVNKKLRS